MFDEPREMDGGADLRAAVFDPLAPALGGRTRLVLAPDGRLARLPFEVLPCDDGRLLLDHHQISYVGTGRDVLVVARGPAGGRGRPLVVADPDYDFEAAGADPTAAPAGNAPGGPLRFGPLPGTRKEGEAVARMLGARLLVGRDAAERAVKDGCRSGGAAGDAPGTTAGGPPCILHLATHGFFLEDQPPAPGVGLDGRLSGRLPENPLLRAGLALAGANLFLAGRPVPDGVEDGLLTAADVAALDLRGTELVVLSACDTGLGEVRAGEGVFGLQRAFLLAGAKTLIMSLWAVPDDVTSELMTAFYKLLLGDRLGPAEALEAAQFTVRKSHTDPYYWGAFICLGESAPLPAHCASYYPRPGR